MPKCERCGHVKANTSFTANEHLRGGHYPWCRTCVGLAAAPGGAERTAESRAEWLAAYNRAYVALYLRRKREASPRGVRWRVADGAHVRLRIADGHVTFEGKDKQLRPTLTWAQSVGAQDITYAWRRGVLRVTFTANAQAVLNDMARFEAASEAIRVDWRSK